MSKIILFIRQPGKPDMADAHPSHEKARAALLEYVRANWTFTDMVVPKNSERAIRAFFARTDGKYVIAEVEGGYSDALSFPGEA